MRHRAESIGGERHLLHVIACDGGLVVPLPAAMVTTLGLAIGDEVEIRVAASPGERRASRRPGAGRVHSIGFAADGIPGRRASDGLGPKRTTVK